MGLCLGKTTTTAASTSPCWTDLPPEIAGEILSRLPTHEDRLSFKTVCREWRLAVLRQGHHQLPPVVPCINFGHGVYQSIVAKDSGSKVRRRRFGMPTDFHVSDAFGSWVIYEDTRSRRCFLRDPFSPSTPAIEVPCSYVPRGDIVTGSWDPRAILLHGHGPFALQKIIVCSSRLVVAVTSYSVLIDGSAAHSACFRPETTVVLWATTDGFYTDIAFHRGKIFAIDNKERLFSHYWLDGEEVRSQQSPANLRENFSFRGLFKEVPSTSWNEHVIKEGPDVLAATDKNHHYYLVSSSDEQKLLMVRWSILNRTNDDAGDSSSEMNLRVFEAELDEGRWSEVKDLGGQVLFVGQTGSRAFSAEGSSEHYYGPKFRGGNRVFILGQDWASAQRVCLGRQNVTKDIPSYCVYDMVTCKTSLVSLNGGHISVKSSKAEWFFPSK